MVFVSKAPSMRVIRMFSFQTQAESDASRGIVRDLPRSSIPPGALYDSTDFILDKPGVVYKRGGTSYQGTTVGATTTGVNFVSAPEFPTGGKVVALGADAHLYDITTASTDAGAFSITTVDRPKLYVDTLVVPASDGTTAPKKVTSPGGTITIGNLGGTPPAGKYAEVHVSRVILGGSTANPNRIYFSPIPNIESTWDTTNAYIDTTHKLSALASIQGVLLAFSSGATERIIGNIPPGTVGENMELQPLGQVGCADARSIAAWGSYVVFASQEGVYVTNGSGFDSLTEKPDGTGILSYWRSLYATVAANSGFIAGGILNRNYYILTLGYSTTIVATLLCYLPRKAWMTLTNIGCIQYAPASSGADELYGATISGHPGNKVLKFSGILSPAAGNKNDANGTAVTPTLQYRMSGEGIGLKRYGDGHLTYDMRDAATDNPTLAVSLDTGIEANSGFVAVDESPLAETTDSVRTRFTISKDAQAVNVKLAQTNASAKTEIYVLEVQHLAFDLDSEVAA